MLKSRSALESYRTPPGADDAHGARAVRLGENAATRLIQLGIYPGGAERVAATVMPLLRVALPDSPVRAAQSGDHLIMRIAPDQYWIVGGESALDSRLRSAVPADAGCVSTLDGARTRLFVEGPAARALLGRLLAIDLHPSQFPIHAFAQTGLHHVGGLLLRSGEDRYEFFALRTYAASMWEVLIDAARSFGFDNLLPESLT